MFKGINFFAKNLNKIRFYGLNKLFGRTIYLQLLSVKRGYATLTKKNYYSPIVELKKNRVLGKPIKELGQKGQVVLQDFKGLIKKPLSQSIINAKAGEPVVESFIQFLVWKRDCIDRVGEELKRPDGYLIKEVFPKISSETLCNLLRSHYDYKINLLEAINDFSSEHYIDIEGKSKIDNKFANELEEMDWGTPRVKWHCTLLKLYTKVLLEEVYFTKLKHLHGDKNSPYREFLENVTRNNDFISNIKGGVEVVFYKGLVEGKNLAVALELLKKSISDQAALLEEFEGE